MDYRFRSPTRRPQDNGAPPPRYRLDTTDGMIIERDVAVPVRGGVTVYADVFRPGDERPAPPLIAWSPYGKHAGSQVTERYPDGGVAPGQLSGYAAFESPDPMYWTARGYAVVNADIPGSWHSGGNATFLSPEEAACGHDFIEWAAGQPWSNGKVGMSGVSYLTSAQWSIAATRPPHLAAINPWEGWSDTYREVARHGGIPETYFWPYIGQRWGCGTQLVEDLAAETAEHPLFDDFWASKAADLPRITVPAFVVASWSDQGLHTRGTFEGFKKISSQRKWLDAHGGKKWGYYYAPESLRRQQAFFDHFLKGADTEVSGWPAVSYEVRDHPGASARRSAGGWPLPGTTYERLFLDAGTGSLRRDPPADGGSVSYDSERACRAAAGPPSTCASRPPPNSSGTPSCGSGCPRPRPTTWMCSSPCKSSTATATPSGSPSTRCSRTARSRWAGSGPRTGNSTRGGPLPASLSSPTGGSSGRGVARSSRSTSRSCRRAPASGPVRRCAWSSRARTSTVSHGRWCRPSTTTRSTGGHI